MPVYIYIYIVHHHDSEFIINFDDYATARQVMTRSAGGGKGDSLPASDYRNGIPWALDLLSFLFISSF